MTDDNKDFTIPEDQDQETQVPGADASAQQKAAEEAENVSQDLPLPKIDFATFIVSLNQSCLFHLGAVEDPTTGKKSKNLAMAKQTIDILGMLEEKTRGNLSTEEDGILKNILYDLRIAYVKEKR
jgi:hypothetical protein